MFTTLGIMVVLFASTNVDDIVVLVGFFADPRFRQRDVLLGQFLGIAILFGLGIVGSLSATFIPRPCIGLLALVPIAIGSKNLVELFRSRCEKPEHHKNGFVGRGFKQVIKVTATTIANGSDNLGIYTPAFTNYSIRQLMLVALVFSVMTAAWCFFALWIVNHPKLGKPIRHCGRAVAPVVLILIGIVVLIQSGTFQLLRELI